MEEPQFNAEVYGYGAIWSKELIETQDTKVIPSILQQGILMLG